MNAVIDALKKAYFELLSKELELQNKKKKVPEKLIQEIDDLEKEIKRKIEEFNDKSAAPAGPQRRRKQALLEPVESDEDSGNPS